MHPLRTALILFLFCSGMCLGPRLPGPGTATAAAQSGSRFPPPGAAENPSPQDERQKRAASRQRQEEIKRAAEKIVQLANELKLAVDRSNEHVLSLEVIKEADEIEKLARSVKEKMKASY
jgi:predicted methyltransferase